jgi:hypothetical protein
VGRLQTVLEAAICQADPVGAEQQASAAAPERFVRLRRASEHGLKVIIARATAGAIWFTATIDRIADILARHGDTDPVAVRRSKAIGILAQPAEALQPLCQRIYLVNASGTRTLGDTEFAEAIWHAAASSYGWRRADRDSIVSQCELRRLLVAGSDDPVCARKPLHDPGRA